MDTKYVHKSKVIILIFFCLLTYTFVGICAMMILEVMTWLKIIEEKK